MATRIQTTYDINPAAGFPGLIARATEPHALDAGVIDVPSAATRNPRPGDAVYYNTTANAFAIPTTAAQLLLAVGILSYRQDQVANADSIVEFLDGEEVQVGVFGTFWVVAGSAMEYGQIIGWDIADFKWDVDSRQTTVATLATLPVVCVSRSPVAANGIAQARIGYGRIL